MSSSSSSSFVVDQPFFHSPYFNMSTLAFAVVVALLVAWVRPVIINVLTRILTKAYPLQIPKRPPPHVQHVASPEELAAQVHKIESTLPLRQNTHKSVTLREPKSAEQLKLAVVYLHGWSSSRLDCEPLPQEIAEELDAHLYCHRLSGHGYESRDDEPHGQAMLDHATPDKLFGDAVEALHVGLQLGERVVLVGFSTGCSLAAWLAVHPEFQKHIAGLVFVSPNFRLNHPHYDVIKWVNATLRALPFGLGFLSRSLVARLAMGAERICPGLNDIAKPAWTHRYPSGAVLHMFDVLWEIEQINMADISMPYLTICNPDDDVVCFRAVQESIKRATSKHKQMLCVASSDLHVCVSQLLSPETVAIAAKTARSFVRNTMLPFRK